MEPIRDLELPKPATLIYKASFESGSHFYGNRVPSFRFVRVIEQSLDYGGIYPSPLLGNRWVFFDLTHNGINLVRISEKNKR